MIDEEFHFRSLFFSRSSAVASSEPQVEQKLDAVLLTNQTFTAKYEVLKCDNPTAGV